ncbi:MAG: hypothetical protein JW850_20800 [Thermoflexales bacterium]|nr:hypothetical protein [Thermoflexales bacterium]
MSSSTLCQQLAGIKLEVFDSVYAGLLPHEREEVDDLVDALARIPKVGDKTARELFVSVVLLTVPGAPGALGASSARDLWASVTRLLRKNHDGIQLSAGTD